MKKMFFPFLIMTLVNQSLNAQTTAEQLADKIALKMKDSLSLNTQQKQQLYTINLQLSDQKAAVRQHYGTTDSVRYHLQQIENTRDSFYRPVLGEEKYLLYRQKKRNLVSNN